ncbi:hypothetical protein ES703_02577 [subsurface metagenome]
MACQPGWYECPYCGICLPTRDVLEAHILLEHPEVPPPVYTCPYCGAEFDSAAGLSGHIALVHPTPPPVYTCPQCGAEFSTQAELDYHIATVHAPEPEPVGTISRKQLEYDEARASIPVYDIPEGQRGLVHIWGRNDMSTSEKLGIYWFVADPDGIVVEEYEDWEWGTTSPGSEHEFIGGRFNLDREKYTMWVKLLMNPDDPEVVDMYIGDLCTVSAPVYRGTISKKELEYDETRSIIPVY